MTSLVPIEVRRYGARGPEVVLLHGGPGAPGSVASLARDLADEFRVLEPLQRRSGGAPLTVKLHVEDLLAVAPSSARIVGWSWGAMLGLSFAALHPEAVRRLVLVGCGTYDEDCRAEYQRRMEERLGPEGREAMDRLQANLAAAQDPAERDRVRDALGASASRAQQVEHLPFVDTGDVTPPDAAGHDETWNDVLRLQSEGVEPARFANVRAGSVMLHGADDPHPGPATRDLLRRFLPALEYVEYARCGHTSWRERHGREPFLRDLRARLRE